ncbi:hypothetical protein, partial [Poseidonibacter sp.]|uniref:hypothetical protein n=1 Tax=Poseidonibacter sp. TaxID=2321188 RepID=UPI003C7508DE
MELKQESDFDNNDEIITKIFKVKDVFFNNGIVNLYQFLKENEFDINFLYEDNLLKISYQEKNSDIYFEILKKFLKEKNIVSFNEKNERIFFDTTLNKFVQSKKINIKNGGSNDSKNSLIRIHIDELKISQSQLLKEEEKYLSKYENSDKEDFKISKCYYDKFKKELYVLSTLDEHIERFSSYLVKEDNLNLNSSIHSFEDGQKSFHDMCKLSKSYTIDKWEALIYWFGTKTQHFYNFSYHMYPNSSNLEALDIFKNEIRINDKKKSFRDEKEKLITTNSNIDFYEQLRKDSIIGKKFTYFFMSKSDVEFELKFFIYLFSKIHHIEDEYINANNRRKNSKEKIYKALKEITFVTYVEDGTFKRSLTEYTKAYLILQFFDKLIEKDLFIYLANLFVT